MEHNVGDCFGCMWFAHGVSETGRAGLREGQRRDDCEGSGVEGDCFVGLFSGVDSYTPGQSVSVTLSLSGTKRKRRETDS